MNSTSPTIFDAFSIAYNRKAESYNKLMSSLERIPGNYAAKHKLFSLVIKLDQAAANLGFLRGRRSGETPHERILNDLSYTNIRRAEAGLPPLNTSEFRELRDTMPQSEKANVIFCQFLDTLGRMSDAYNKLMKALYAIPGKYAARHKLRSLAMKFNQAAIDFGCLCGSGKETPAHKIIRDLNHTNHCRAEAGLPLITLGELMKPGIIEQEAGKVAA